MRDNMISVWFIFILLGTTQVFGQGGTDPGVDSGEDRNIDTPFEALNYLEAYGFNGPPGEAEGLIDEEKLESLILKFQKKFGLSETDSREKGMSPPNIDGLIFAGFIQGKLDNETKEWMSYPRCGNPDLDPEDNSETRKKRFARIGGRWPTNSVTWYISGYTLDRDLNNAQVDEEIRTAFERWASNSALTFTRVANRGSADILLSFNRGDHNDGSPFDGPGGTLAHAFPPPSQGILDINGDVHFDDEETFSTDGGIVLHQVAVHEIGHSLGLGHSSDRYAVMAPFFRRGISPSSFSLQSDDIAGIQSIYGANIGPPQVPQVPMNTPPTTTTTTTPAPTTTTSAPTTTPTRTVKPLYCNGIFDAATEGFQPNILYLFQEKQVFKYIKGYGIFPGYPTPINEEFPGVPDFVDAALTYTLNPTYRIIYIFKGDDYWRFDDGATMADYPRSITRNWGGVPANLNAAFVWSGNGLWYFVKGNEYYRYNIYRRTIDVSYPRPFKVWRGVYPNVSAVTAFEGRTYFFQDQFYQRFYDRSFQASSRVQTAPDWLGCITQGLELLPTDNPTTFFTEEATAGSGSFKSHFALVVLSLVIYLIHIH